MVLVFNQHAGNWPKHRPLCVHAEGKTTAAILLIAELLSRPVHICHVARKEEVSMFVFNYVDNRDYSCVNF